MRTLYVAFFAILLLCSAISPNSLYAQGTGGDRWVSLNGPDTNRVTAVQEAPDLDDQLFATTFGGGVFARQEHTAWISLGDSLNDRSVRAFGIIEQDRKAILFVATPSGVFRSVYQNQQSNLSWSKTGSGIIDGQIFCLAIDDALSVEQIYAGGTNGVYKSEDLGITWTKVSKGLPNDTVTALGVWKGMGVLFAGFASSGTYQLTTSDSVWRISDSATIGSPVVGMSMYEIEPRSTAFYAASYRSIRISDSVNAPWRSASELGMPPSDIRCVHGDGRVGYDPYYGVIGTADSGVYLYSTIRSRWIPWNEKLTDLRITTIAPIHCYILAKRSRGNSWAPMWSNCGLIVGTEKSGVFLYTPYMSGVNEHTDNVSNPVKLRISPNPGSSILQIHFTLPTVSRVTVTLSDNNGGAVTSITPNTYFDRGEGRIVISTESLPSGVYHVRLRAGVLESSGQVVVVR